MSSEHIVLIIDDDAEQGAALAARLQGLGFETRLASASDDMLAMLDTEFHSIVLDLMMTREDGIQIIRRLGEARCDANIVITGDADRRILSAAERLARARGLRVSGSLAKPIDEPRLRDMLESGVVPAGAGSRGINIQ
ncbi:MAG: response regulator, partial [Gammaproteobacteria bacterium]